MWERDVGGQRKRELEMWERERDKEVVGQGKRELEMWERERDVGGKGKR